MNDLDKIFLGCLVYVVILATTIVEVAIIIVLGISCCNNSGFLEVILLKCAA